ncbi:hypothetical protein B0O99DRAFT_701234 [Bisporella sp. PMI_857]|nr:hypothetical protein B0O99DRAFT_701234 [Bisporella sp. PMI_857]
MSTTGRNQQSPQAGIAEADRSVFQPEIDPRDQAWLNWRSIFKTELASAAVLDVMNRFFTPAEQSYVMPPPQQGNTLQIQTEDGALYKACFQRGARFEHTPDNLVTKFTMLHFGLPIEHITLNNINNCGKEEDVSDEDDAKEDQPRVQRILYAEKPLQFLEGYHERSHGFPILRRPEPKYNVPASSVPITSAGDRSRSEGGRGGVGGLVNGKLGKKLSASSRINTTTRQNRPIFPESPLTVSQRGGASPSTQVPLEGTPRRHHAPHPSQPNPLSQAAKVPKFHQPRYLAPKAGRAKVRTWETFMEGQNYLNTLQRDSYVRDQSVIQPGKEPMAPLYGQSRELMLRTSDQLPTVYLQRLTPMDYEQLREENQYLRNRILDRETACQICCERFENYEPEKIAAHARQHREALQEDGQCAWCADTNYGFMSAAQKRSHLKQHFDLEDTIKIQSFWKDQQCPVCGHDFTSQKPEEIINHCLNSHSPGMVQFCDKCGANTYNMNDSELDYHQRRCRNQPEKAQGAPDSAFCERCGKDISAESSEEAKRHEHDCLQQLAITWFCSNCGINFTTRDPLVIRNHQQSCRPPGGWRRKFCQQCGTNLSELDEDKRSSHKDNCLCKKDPAIDFRKAEAKLADLYRKDASVATREAAILVAETHYQRRLKDLQDAEMSQDPRGSLPMHKTASSTQNEKSIAALKEEIKALKEVIRKNNEPVNKTAKDRHQVTVDCGECPFHGCAKTIGKMTREDLFSHLQKHAAADTFWLCPLRGPDGSTECTEGFGVRHKNYKDQIRGHFKHLHDSPQGTSTALKQSSGDSIKQGQHEAREASQFVRANDIKVKRPQISDTTSDGYQGIPPGGRKELESPTIDKLSSIIETVAQPYNEGNAKSEGHRRPLSSQLLLRYKRERSTDGLGKTDLKRSDTVSVPAKKKQKPASEEVGSSARKPTRSTAESAAKPTVAWVGSTKHPQIGHVMSIKDNNELEEDEPIPPIIYRGRRGKSGQN